LNNKSLTVEVTAPSDTQVTHIRIYRTTANGSIYYQDQDIPVDFYAYGICYSWEESDAYISGNAYKFTITDSTHSTENTYSWEEDVSQEADVQEFYAGLPWYATSEAMYQAYIKQALAFGVEPLSYEEFLDRFT